MTNAAKKLIPILLAALCLLSACGAERAAPPEELPDVFDTAPAGMELKEPTAADRVFSLNYDPDGSMNPIRADNSVNMQLWSLMYDSVFTVDENFEVSSEVVTEVKSDDYIWWVFNIDAAIPFTDGSTLTAADVVYSIQRAQQTAYYGQRLSIIYGISAMGTDCFAVTTKYADSQFPALLNIPIIKKDTYFDDVPVGSGPYRLAPGGDRLELFVSNRHASEMPVSTIYLKDCTDISEKIRYFEDATLDVVTNDPTGMYNLGYGSNNETRYYDTSNMHYIGFNMDSMYFSGYPARRAVNYVVDRERIVNEYLDGCGVVSTLPVHPKTDLYDGEYAAGFSFAPDKASALFEAAGVSDYDHDDALEMMVTGIVVELKIKFIVNNDSTAKVMAARRICEELNAIGITTVLRELSWSDYIEALEDGNYDMYYGELRLSPDWNLSELFRVREKRKEGEAFSGMNYGNIRDETYTNLYAAYLAAGDESSRMAAFGELSRYIGDTGVILPICFERREILTHRGVVTGADPTQYDIFHRFYDWTIDLK